MFHRIHARFGAIRVYRAALASYAFMFISFIWMVKLGLDEDGGWGWAVLAMHIAVSCIASLGFGESESILASDITETNAYA
jgi:hypothetical protein